MRRSVLSSLLAVTLGVTHASAARAQDAAAPEAVPTPAPAPEAPATEPVAPTTVPDAPAPVTAPDTTPSTPVPAPSAAPAKVAARSPTAGPQLEGPRDGRPDCRVGAAVCLANDNFALWPRLRLRNGVEFVQADSQVLTVGQNDGFYLDQNRIGLDGAFKDDLRFRMIIDVVSLLPGSAPNDPVQPFSAAVRDAWVAWMPSDWFFVSGGQQFMPADLEGTTTIAALPFTRRSVATSGVRPGHGFAVDGLSPSRQPGIVLGSTEKARLGNIALQYLVGVGNGNGQNTLGNDNKLPATYGRFGAGYVGDDGLELRVGVGGRYNPRTVGTLPNLFLETESVGFVDLELKVAGIELAAQGIYKDVAFDSLTPTIGADGAETGLGATAWLTVDKPLGIDIFGLRPAYRISYFDPSSSFADDAVLENTLALRWDTPLQGLSLIVDATLLTEIGEGVRDLDNARGTALLQLEL
jgi:hypothetical protein